MDVQWQIIGISLKVAVSAVLLDAPAAIYLGWFLARKSFAGKAVINTILTLPLVLPPVVTGYLLLLVFGRTGIVGRWLEYLCGISLAFTWQAAAIASAVIAFPLFVRSVQVAIIGVDPKLEEAGRVLRLSESAIFLRLTMPLAWPGIIAGTLLAFARSLGEFGATIVFAGNIPGETQTLTLKIFTLVNQPEGEEQVPVFLLISVALAFGSVLVNEWLIKRSNTKTSNDEV